MFKLNNIQTLKLTVVIPAYNEELRLFPRLGHVKDYLKQFAKAKGLDVDIIIVNDGSTDKTGELLLKESGVKSINLPENVGKGGALLEGVRASNSDWIYIADSDFSTPIEELNKFWETKEGYDCVIGSRALKQSQVKVSPLRKFLGNFGNVMIRTVLDLPFKDTQCGFKLFNQDAAKLFLECKNKRWGFDFEFLYILNQHSMKVKELPVEWEEIGDSRVKPLHYFTTLYELIKVRLMH
jgi:dolichyl-phosphate beta-glucosyltransferase